MTRISTLVLAFASVAVGIKIDFPSAGDYWVACGYNNLRWTPEANDPSIFSVVLQGTNKTKLNDDYSVGNSLVTRQGVAQIYVPCIPADDNYHLMLINPDNYTHNHNGVYVDSSKFAIKPNGTGPALNSHQTSISETPDQDLAVASTNASMIPAGSSGTPTVVPQKTAPVQMTPATVSINAAKPAASVIPPETTESKSNGAGVAFAPRIVALAAASLLSAGIIVLF